MNVIVSHTPHLKRWYASAAPPLLPKHQIWLIYLYTQHWGPVYSQLIVATLVPSTPICLFFKLQCKQTVVTYFCIGFVNNIHIIGKGMIKETWIAKIKEIGCWTEELITFCPFSQVSAWSKKLPNFVVKHVDLSWDFGHDMPCMAVDA